MSKYQNTLLLLLIISLLITPALSLEKEITEPATPINYEDIKQLSISDQLNKTIISGIGFATDKDVSIIQVKDTIEIKSVSKKPSVVFIPADINYKYLVRHYVQNMTSSQYSIDNEDIVYAQLIDDEYYVVFDADEWSYYTVDGSLIQVVITDIRLVGDEVQITGDGYDGLVLQADYANDKLYGWNQKLPTVNNPWITRGKYSTHFVGSVALTSINSGTSVLFHTNDNYVIINLPGYIVRSLCQWSHSTTNNYYQYQFYIDSDHISAQDVVIDAYTLDHIDHFKVEFYNLTAGAYQEVLNDDVYTAANLINLNNSSTGLDFALYHTGHRGDTVSVQYGNTSKPDQTVSAYYGVINRILMLFRLPADDGADSVTSGASQVKIRLTVYYVDPGYATYEFEDGPNDYYGLDNIDDGTLMLFKAGTQNVTYITNSSDYTITGMTVRADENELIDRLFITYSPTPINLLGLIINQTAIDVDTDSDGDNVPDAFEDANITVNKNAQGGELEWDYLWYGAYNHPNSTGYMYYTNLINGSGLYGTDIQTASTTGTANISMNTAGAGKTCNFTVHSGTSDRINITDNLDTNSVYVLRYSNDTFIEGQSTDTNQYVNFTTDLTAGTYYIEKSDIVIWLFNSTAGAYSNTTTDILQPGQGFLVYPPKNFTWTRSDL